MRACLIAVALAALATGSSCMGGVDLKIARSDRQRLAKECPADDMATLARGMRQDAFELFGRLSDAPGNLVFSPVSLQFALAMVLAGARGQTAAQIREALHVDLAGESFHTAMNALEALLASRQQSFPRHSGRPRKVGLSMANALWAQDGLAIEQAFLDRLAIDYGSDLKLLDFAVAPDEAADTINSWVLEQTRGKIRDLIAPESLNALTRLVLTNAVYLDADWAWPFEEHDTGPSPFTTLEGPSHPVSMMHQQARYPYARGDGWQAVELAYAGRNLAMLFVVPDPGRYREVEARITHGLLDEARNALAPADVELGLPRFEYRFRTGLATPLQALGMRDAFDAERADFTGISPAKPLFIGQVLHETFIKVDEEGTEAAAATAVFAVGAAAPAQGPVELIVDRPFLFSLHDRETGAILFLGRVLDP